MKVVKMLCWLREVAISIRGKLPVGPRWPSPLLSPGSQPQRVKRSQPWKLPPPPQDQQGSGAPPAPPGPSRPLLTWEL